MIGASSFIGRNFVSFAATKGLDICATYFRDRTLPDFVRHYRNVHLANLDVMNDSVPKQFDTCLYLAGNSDHAASFKDPTMDLMLNGLGLVNLLQRSDHFETFIFLSSAAVYHGHRGFVSPRTCLFPEHPYAISKNGCTLPVSDHTTCIRPSKNAPVQFDWFTSSRPRSSQAP